MSVLTVILILTTISTVSPKTYFLGEKYEDNLELHRVKRGRYDGMFLLNATKSNWEERYRDQLSPEDRAANDRINEATKYGAITGAIGGAAGGPVGIATGSALGAIGGAVVEIMKEGKK